VIEQLHIDQPEGFPDFEGGSLGTDIVLNGGKNLRILITAHPEMNMIILNMQVPPTASTHPEKPGGGRNKPKAVFHGG